MMCHVVPFVPELRRTMLCKCFGSVCFPPTVKSMLVEACSANCWTFSRSRPIAASRARFASICQRESTKSCDRSCCTWDSKWLKMRRVATKASGSRRLEKHYRRNSMRNNDLEEVCSFFLCNYKWLLLLLYNIVGAVVVVIYTLNGSEMGQAHELSYPRAFEFPIYYKLGCKLSLDWYHHFLLDGLLFRDCSPPAVAGFVDVSPDEDDFFLADADRGSVLVVSRTVCKFFTSSEFCGNFNE